LSPHDRAKRRPNDKIYLKRQLGSQAVRKDLRSLRIAETQRALEVSIGVQATGELEVPFKERVGFPQEVEDLARLHDSVPRVAVTDGEFNHPTACVANDRARHFRLVEEVDSQCAHEKDACGETCKPLDTFRGDAKGLLAMTPK
jgi:hypothetical protein